MRERSAIRAKYAQTFPQAIVQEQQQQQEQLQQQQQQQQQSAEARAGTRGRERGQRYSEDELLTRGTLPATSASLAASACVQPNAAYLAYKSKLEEAAILMADERRAWQQAKPTPAKNHRFDN